MWRDDDTLITQQWGIRGQGLLMKDIQSGARHDACLKGVHERSLIEDGSA